MQENAAHNENNQLKPTQNLCMLAADDSKAVIITIFYMFRC